jgi:hypothetical protein
VATWFADGEYVRAFDLGKLTPTTRRNALESSAATPGRTVALE